MKLLIFYLFFFFFRTFPSHLNAEKEQAQINQPYKKTLSLQAIVLFQASAQMLPITAGNRGVVIFSAHPRQWFGSGKMKPSSLLSYVPQRAT